jgi:hypothetical protein
MWAADDRRDLIRASDYPTSDAWLVTIEGMTVSNVQPTYSSTRTTRWTALINGVSVLGGRAVPSRDKAAIQVPTRTAVPNGLTSIGASVPFIVLFMGDGHGAESWRH